MFYNLKFQMIPQSNSNEGAMEPLRDFSIGENGKRSVADIAGVLLSRIRVAKFHKYIKKSGDPVELLDIGCGYEAHLSINFINKVERIYLADVSINTNLLRFPGVVFLRGDLNKTVKSLSDNSIDLIIASNVIEHLSDPRFILMELSRLLKPGGMLMIIVPNWRGKSLLEFMAFKLRISPAYEINDHKWYFSKSELWTLIRSAGFSPEFIKIKTVKFGTCTYAIVSNPMKRSHNE